MREKLGRPEGVAAVAARVKDIEHRLVTSQHASRAPSSALTTNQRPVQRVAPEYLHALSRRLRGPLDRTIPRCLCVGLDQVIRLLGYGGVFPLRLGDPLGPGGVRGSD